MNRIKGVSLIALGVGLVAAAAHADEADQSSTQTQRSMKSKQVDEVVVQGTRDVPLQTTYSEGKIPAAEIRELPASATQTIQTLLNTQPSIIAFTDGPLGVRTNIYLRAFNSGQFAETFDGVALNDVFNAGVTNQASVRNNQLATPNDIDGVDIYRGINNPSVNSYNSLGGTVNFQPRQPTADFGGSAGAGYGSFNTVDWNATVNTGDLDGVRQILSFDHGSSDGWNLNTQDRNNNLYYGVTYSPSNETTLADYFIYNNNTGWTPFDMPVPLLDKYGSNYMWPRDWTSSFDKDTNWNDILEAKSELSSYVTFDSKFFGGYDDYRRTSFSNPLFQQSATQPYVLENVPNSYPFWLNNSGYPNGPTYDPAALFGSPQAGTDYHFYGYATWDAGYQPTLTISLSHNIVTVGGNITYGALHSREYWYGSSDMPNTVGYNDAWDEHDNRLFASGYIQDEVSLFDDRLHVTPGVKYIYADTTDNDSVGFYYPMAGTVSDTEHFVAPSIGASYTVLDGLAAYAAFGQNVKFPDIGAYYGAFQTNASGLNVIVPPHVVPEHVNDYEAGLRYQQNRISGSLAFYREDFTNTFITETSQTLGTSFTTNGGSSQYQGVELEGRADLGQLWLADLDTYFNYSHNEAKFTSSFTSENAGQVSAGQPLAGVPTDLLNVGVDYKGDNWQISANGRYVGDQFIDQLSSGLPTANVIKAHFTLDMSGYYTIPVQGLDGRIKSVKLSLSATNLLDKHYLNEAFTDQNYSGNNFIRGIEAAPRSIFGSVTVAF